MGVTVTTVQLGWIEGAVTVVQTVTVAGRLQLSFEVVNGCLSVGEVNLP